MKREGLRDENEIILRAAAVWKEAGGRPDALPDGMPAQVFSRSPVRYGDFRKAVIILKTTLERL
jgi:hypothetical protein